MNKVVLIGRLTRDPELKFTAGSGVAVTTFTLAVDRNFKNKEGQREADFINCVSYNKLAETMANYLKKGRLIAVSGRIETRTFEGNDGQKRYYTDVVVDDFQFLEKKDATATYTPKPTPEGPTNTGAQKDEDFFPLNGDNEVPF
ncbi:MAG: single-stranded DNA-binding protein [Clostridiales bacterium]|nr:single-stranded DNA-binding protein [Clostridiales bacterium]